MSSSIIIAHVCALLLSLLSFAIGFHGTLVHNRPVCRRCKFELEGLIPEGPAPPGTRCPECGSRLADSPRAIQRETRRKNRLWLAAGILGLFVIVGLPVYSILSSQGAMQRHKPVWLLGIEIRSKDPARANIAANELLRRSGINMDFPSQERIHAIADTILDIQASEDAPWTPEFGDVLGTWRQHGLIDDERWSRYISRTFKGSIQVRQRTRAKGTLAVTLSLDPHRAGRFGNVFEWWSESLTIGTTDVSIPGDRTRMQVSAAGGSSVTFSVPVDLPIGAYPIRSTIGLAPIESVSGSSRERSPSLNFEFEAEKHVEFVGPDEQLIRLTDDPETAAGVRASVTVERAQWLRTDSGELFLSIHIELDGPPVGICHELVFVWRDADGAEHAVPQGFVTQIPRNTKHHIFTEPFAALIPGPITLRFIPNPARAETVPGLDVLYAGSWEITGIVPEIAPERR